MKHGVKTVIISSSLTLFIRQQTHDHSLFHTLTSILVTEFPVIKIETKSCAVLTKFKHLIPYNGVHKRKVCTSSYVTTIQKHHLKKVFNGYKTLNYWTIFSYSLNTCQQCLSEHQLSTIITSVLCMLAQIPMVDRHSQTQLTIKIKGHVSGVQCHLSFRLLAVPGKPYPLSNTKLSRSDHFLRFQAKHVKASRKAMKILHLY